jgi:hypothetical protein
MRHNKTLIILLILLFYGCKQEKNIPYYQIGNETKAWVYYETGSFWIYQDTILYQTDSIAVDSSLLEKKYHGQISSHDATYYYDSLKMTYNENYYSLNTDHMISGSSLTRQYADGSVYPFFSLENNELGKEVYFNNGDGVRIGSTTFLNHYVEYTLLGYKFQNVFEVRVLDFIHQRAIYYLIAINVGIIKQRVEDQINTQTWNLIRWHVTQ